MSTATRIFDRRYPTQYSTLSGFDFNDKQFIGNFGFHNPYREYIMFELDDYDREYFYQVLVNLKDGERVIRFETEKTQFQHMRPLVKINVDKCLVYFNVADPDTEGVVWETRGTKMAFLNLVQ